MPPPRIPPIHCLLSFEALARLRSVTLAADELNVTPSAVSHRMRQLESQLGVRLFARNDFTLSADGATYLAQVRQGLQALQQLPGSAPAPRSAKLRLAVTPTFSRQILLPRLALFRHAYPDVELILQVAIPMLDVKAEEADLEIRYGTGPYAGVEQVRILSDEIVPVCSPEYLNEAGPFDGFDSAEDIRRAGHRVEIDLKRDAPFVTIDDVLLEQRAVRGRQRQPEAPLDRVDRRRRRARRRQDRHPRARIEAREIELGPVAERVGATVGASAPHSPAPLALDRRARPAADSARRRPLSAPRAAAEAYRARHMLWDAAALFPADLLALALSASAPVWLALRLNRLLKNRRLVRALAESPLMGPANNARFLRDLLDHAAFRRGEMTTQLLDDWQRDAAPLLQRPAEISSSSPPSAFCPAPCARQTRYMHFGPSIPVCAMIRREP